MAKRKTTRRAFLKGSVAIGGAALTAGTSVKASEGDPLITETQEWAPVSYTHLRAHET